MQRFFDPGKLLEDIGAILDDDHIVGASGRHLKRYIDVSRLESFPEDVERLCAHIVANCPDEADVVVGPAGGADFIVRSVAHSMSRRLGKDVPAVLAERRGNKFALAPENAKSLDGANVLVVDDVLNEGGTLGQFPGLVARAWGTLVGAAVVCTHQRVDAKDLGVRWLYAAVSVESESWTAEKCLIQGPCSRGVPVNTKVGHGKEFLREQAIPPDVWDNL